MTYSTYKYVLRHGYAATFKLGLDPSNEIQKTDNEVDHLVIFCLNCLRCHGNSTSKSDLGRSVRIRAEVAKVAK